MTVTSRGIDGGVDINVLVDSTASGDAEMVKLAVGTVGSAVISPGDATNGLDVDVTRMVPGTSATSLGKAEDSAAASADTGVFILAIRRDAATNDVDAAGDYSGIHVDALGRLYVTGVHAEDAAAASGDLGHFMLAIRRDAPTSSAAAGDYHEIQVDALGRVWTSGSYAEDAVATSGDYGKFVLAVRRDAKVASSAAGDYHELQVDAVGALWTADVQTEDAVAASGDRGSFVLAVRRDTPTSGAAAGDYHELEVDALGRLWVSGTQAEDAAHTSGDTGQFILAVQSLARTSRSADNDYTPVAVDAAGAIFGAVVPENNSAWAASSHNSISAASGVIKASAGKLYRLKITNDNAAARWFQLFNLTAVPADTTVPTVSVQVPANTTIPLEWGDMGKYFSTGISWSNSTTGGQKTLAGTDMHVDAQYL
jgi:hypothetical protein